MSIYNPIENYETYNLSMAKPLMDKLFFADKLGEVENIVDFGCANGILTHKIKELFPKSNVIGFDIDPIMIEQSKNANDQMLLFLSDWNLLQKSYVPGKKAIILSSVIHEVYSYGEMKSIDLFWKQVFQSNFDYIFIRDMTPSKSIDRNSDINDVAKILRKFRGTKELRDFETRWGSIHNNKNLVHFLLKYNFVEPNWEREVRENYIPLMHEELLSMIPTEYTIMYHEHGVLPFIKRQIKNDFGIELKDPVNLKIILEKI